MIPVSSAAPGAGHDVPRPEAPAILVVDDNRANLIAFQATLEPLDYPVVKATSGEEALKHLLQRDFALILLDVQMPDMNGFELAALIKSHARLSTVPIIFVTAISRDSTQVFTGYARGAVDYLLKPFDPEMLRAKVSVFVELHRTQQTIRAQAQLLHEHRIREVERQSEERFRGLTESMPLPLLAVQADGTVRAVNRAWTEFSGLTAEQTGFIVHPGCVHPADVESARAGWADGSRAGAAFEVECRLLRAQDAAYRWHLLRAVPQRGPRSPDAFWIVAGIDIEPQKTSEQERARMLAHEQRAREEAEAANRMKDEFLAMVSHELRTPLNAILGWSRMVRTGTLVGADLARAIETIERNAHVQAKLINDILDTSRIVSGKLRLQVGALDLCCAVAHEIDGVRPAADAKGVDLVWQRPVAAVDLVGDGARLQQVAHNLLSNAVKFTPKGGRVEVRVERDGDHATLLVKDTGRGIRPGFLPHVFDRFRQEDATMGREHEGLGLGLSIVKHLVELHGGQVSAESGGLGQGAVFGVRLPTDGHAAQQSAAPDTPVFRDAGRPRHGLPRLDGTTVLFVDDSSEARELVVFVLNQHGARVVAVETAEQALSEMRAQVPSVLVSDIGLPGDDGYALIRRVRALDPAAGGNVPAIALTGFARPEDQRRARHEGFQVHMAKPLEPAELIALIASLVRAPETTPSLGLHASV